VSGRISRGQTPLLSVTHRRWQQTRGARAMVVLPAMAIALTASILLEPEERARSVLATPSGPICVEVANTPASRARGLAGRDRIDLDGLLLEWPKVGRHPIWMAGMKFPLDLVWLDAEGFVSGVANHVRPCGQTPCPLHEPAGLARSVAVLELPAGDARRRGLQVGMRIEPLGTLTAARRGACR
jgi:uncharacterized protein